MIDKNLLRLSVFLLSLVIVGCTNFPLSNLQSNRYAQAIKLPLDTNRHAVRANNEGSCAHPDWSDSQKELYKHFRPSIHWEDCTTPDYSDTSHTNFTLNLPNGQIVEMVYCPRGVVALGEPVEDAVSRLYGTFPYKSLKETINKQDLEFLHHVYVMGFWISKNVFSAKDFKELCPYVGNDNNDHLGRGQDSQGLTWNEAMMIGGVLEKLAQKNKVLNFNDEQHWAFRLPTAAELRYATLAGSIETTTNSPTNSWGIELSGNYLWCYDPVHNSEHLDKKVYDHVVTNGLSAYLPTEKRKVATDCSARFLSMSPYDMLMSPKARLVLAECGSTSILFGDPYLPERYYDSLGIGNISYLFLNERILWSKAFFLCGIPTSSRFHSLSSSRKAELEQNLKDYIAFMQPFAKLGSPDVTKNERDILLGYSLLVGDYVMFRALTKLGTKTVSPLLPPAMHLAAAACSTNYLEGLYSMGEKINARDSNGMTPLHAAVAANEKENVKWLLGHGAKPDLRDVDGKTPFDIAKENRFYDIIEIFEQQEPKIAEKTTSLGTAFFINENTAVTCNHVVEGHREIWAETESGTRLTFSVIGNNSHSDIAILRMTSGEFQHTYLPLSITQQAVADNIFTIGYPLPDIMGSKRKYTEGTVSAQSGIGDDPRVYQVSIPLQPGNSGGPVVSENGMVVGVASSVLDSGNVFALTGTIPQNVNYAVKSFFVAILLQENGIDFSTESPLPEHATKKEIVNHVSRATILLRAR